MQTRRIGNGKLGADSLTILCIRGWSPGNQASLRINDLVARVLKGKFWNIVGRERKLWWKVKYWGKDV